MQQPDRVNDLTTYLMFSETILGQRFALKAICICSVKNIFYEILIRKREAVETEISNPFKCDNFLPSGPIMLSIFTVFN